jgi:uncharacterized protein YjbI with pentapeptide repeats
MTKKLIDFCFFAFALAALLIAATNVYSQDCYNCYHEGNFVQGKPPCAAGVKCIYYEFSPSLPSEGADHEEYYNKLKSAPELYGLNDNIWLDGKKKTMKDWWHSPRTTNYDFALLHGYFWNGDDENLSSVISNCSFYGSILRYSTFSTTAFDNCDFRYANLIGADFSESGIYNNCKLYGAKIKMTKFGGLSKEQFLSTDPFIEKISGTGNKKKQIYLEGITIRDLRYHQDGEIYDYFLHHKIEPPIIEYKSVTSFDGIDFNKFRNNSRAELPCVIRGCQLGQSLVNCNFSHGTIENSIFGNDTLLFLYRKVEKCDFSNAKLKNVDFTTVSLKDSIFEDTEIRGVNFAGRISFYNLSTHDSNGKLWTPETAASRKLHTVKVEKLLIPHFRSRGLQKDQLQKTSSFKNKKIIDCKFCMDMSGLNFSQFILMGCHFACDFTNVNFTDSIITDCFFAWDSNITIDQVKSTWNYKNNRMEGIKLPAKIQKILDAEKQTATNAASK